MFPRTIRGWFTEIPSWRGRDGTRIPEFGLAARTSRSESASESASSAVSDGAGVIGDSIGITDYAIYDRGRYYSRSNTFYNRSSFYRRRRRAADFIAVELPLGAGAYGRGVAGDSSLPMANVGARGGVYNRPGATARAFQRKHPGGSRIRCTPRSERRPLGRLQRLRPWRTGKELFVARKRQLRWRRISRRWRISRRRIARWRRAPVIEVRQASA